MIRYKKGWWGTLVLVRMYGSSFPRALPASLSATLLAILLAIFFQEILDDQFINPYPYQTFAFIVGFMIVFRSNLSYGRYNEGRSHLATLMSKLSDATEMCINFDRMTIHPSNNPTEQDFLEHEWFRNTLIHLVSLVHGVALATLRLDFNMENIVVHDSSAAAPRSNIRRQVDNARITALENKAAPKRKQRTPRRFNGPAAHAGADAHSGPVVGARDPTTPRLYTASAGTEMTHAHYIYSVMKLSVIGGLTQAEGVSLGAFTTSGSGTARRAIPDLNTRIHGYELPNGTYAPAPTERVHTVLSWIQQLIIERIASGGIKAPPPVQSRIHQVISDAMLGYEHCKKLVDTPFPFPWAQAVNFVLMLFTYTLPFVVVAHTTGITVAACITFAAVQTHVMLNEMQYKLNERLLSIAYSARPPAFTDYGDLKGPGNTVALDPIAAAATEPSKSPKSGQEDPSGMSAYASLPMDAVNPEGFDVGRKVSVELTPGRGSRFAQIALAAAAQKSGTPAVPATGQTPSSMSGQSPAASTTDRPSTPFSRPVVQCESDLQSFSANNEKMAAIHMKTLRWRANARPGPSQQELPEPTASGTTPGLESAEMTLNNKDGFPTASKDSAKQEEFELPLAGEKDVQPQVVVVGPDSAEASASEAQEGLNLPQAPKETPFDEQSAP